MKDRQRKLERFFHLPHNVVFTEKQFSNFFFVRVLCLLWLKVSDEQRGWHVTPFKCSLHQVGLKTQLQSNLIYIIF